MTPSLEKLQQVLKQLPGLGYRSAERIALHLILEKPEKRIQLLAALESAATHIARCSICGNVAEIFPEEAEDSGAPLCEICMDTRRQADLVCVVEQVPDLIAMERSGAFRGRYHVLYGKLSPIQGVGEADLNLETLRKRLDGGEVSELILALSNDIEGEATCHFIQEEVVGSHQTKVSRIGFGLPSGSGIGFADSVTLKSALEGRKKL